MESASPILWHIEISHYSEKARWALAFKSLEHERRAPLPGMHIPLALWLTRGRALTLPILELDGRRIADSAAIIDALERRAPEPALYPERRQERERALALQAWFDRELGPYIRRLVFYELRRDRDRMAEIGERAAPAVAARFGRLGVPYTRAFTAMRYGAGSAAAAERARAKVLAAIERLEAELDGNQYLAGGRFSVADLAAAALLYPLVLPPQGPAVAERMPEPYERFRAPLRSRRAYRWVQEIYDRHRAPGPGAGAAARQA